MWAWSDESRDLSRVHAARLQAWADTVPLAPHPAAFGARHGALTSPLRQMPTRCEGQLEAQALPLAKAQGLTRLHNHWDGRTVLVERPEGAMDNQTAERVLRHPVVGRKHSEGSGSGWSAHRAAMMVSVRHTVGRGHLTPPHGLPAFFPAGADHGGTSPPDRSAFLPWQRTPEHSEERARPGPVTLPPCASASQTLGEPQAADTS